MIIVRQPSIFSQTEKDRGFAIDCNGSIDLPRVQQSVQCGSVVQQKQRGAGSVMHMNSCIIEAAYECRYRQYEQRRLWGIDYHLKCWELGMRAFEDGSFEAFGRLYEELRGSWQVFRSKNFNPPPAEDLYGLLQRMDQGLRNLRLGDMAALDCSRLQQVWKALTEVGIIKENQDGPSVMATSKFLHFFNPRLFVIVDREAMRDWVFRHAWLRNQVEAVHDILPRHLPTECCQHRYFQTDLRWLLAIIVWSGQVLQANPGINAAFDAHIRKHATVTVPEDMGTYDAAAIEWLLLGLVELPPEGVTIDGECLI